MPKKVRQMRSMLRKMRPAIMLRTGNVVASSSHHCAASCAGSRKLLLPGDITGVFVQISKISQVGSGA